MTTGLEFAQVPAGLVVLEPTRNGQPGHLVGIGPAVDAGARAQGHGLVIGWFVHAGLDLEVR